MDRADLYKPRSQKLSCGFLNDWLSPSPLGSRSLLKSIWKIWRQPHCFTRLIDLNRLFHWRGISTCEFIYSKFHVFKPCLPASRHLFFHSFVNSLFHSSQCFLIPFSVPVRWKSQPNGHANSNDYLYQDRRGPFVRILLLLWKWKKRDCLGFGVISAWEEWMG